jgi:hypothetical protein
MEVVHLPENNGEIGVTAAAGAAATARAAEVVTPESHAVDWGKPMSVPYTSERGMAIVNL